MDERDEVARSAQPAEQAGAGESVEERAYEIAFPPLYDVGVVGAIALSGLLGRLPPAGAQLSLATGLLDLLVVTFVLPFP